MLKNLNAKHINSNDNFLSCREYRVRGKKEQCPLHRHCQVTKDLLYLSYVFFSHFIPLIRVLLSHLILTFRNKHNLCFYFMLFKAHPTHKNNLFSLPTVGTITSSDKVTFFIWFSFHFLQVAEYQRVTGANSHTKMQNSQCRQKVGEWLISPPHNIVLLYWPRWWLNKRRFVGEWKLPGSNVNMEWLVDWRQTSENPSDRGTPKRTLLRKILTKNRFLNLH